jgi:hypothetical protein
MPTNQTLPERILAAYYELAARPYDRVSLVDLHDHFPYVERDRLNRTLLAMHSRHEIHVEPAPDPSRQTREAIVAAISRLDGYQFWANPR